MQSATRAIEALFLLERPQRIDMLAQRLGVHRTTALRLVQVLAKFQLVNVDASGTVSLASGTVTLANLYRRTNPWLAEADRVLSKLRDETGETATFFVVAGDERVCLLRQETASGLRQSVQVGQRFPLLLGAAGKAILAHLPPQQRSLILDRCASTSERVRIEKEVEKVVALGYSVSMAEREEGVGSVAAPVLNADGFTQGAVSVSGPVARLEAVGTERLAMAVKEVSRDFHATFIYGEVATG
jgi:DNA-binding IclR family transcriptional regulator